MASELNIIKSLSIVLLGNFNPIIFQPYWFASKNLIREEEASFAEVSIIHPTLVQFRLDWATLSVSQDQFQISATNENYFEAVRDLVISTFEILKETPISALGINHNYDFSLETQKQYKEFSNWLYSSQIWQSGEDEIKLLSLEIYSSKKENGELGNQRIKIIPSDIPNLKFGVSINFNNYIQLQTDSSITSASNAMTAIEKNWKLTAKNTNSIVTDIWQKFIERN